MRFLFVPLVLAVVAAPAAAQSPVPAPPPVQRSDPTAEIARVVADPATADRLARTMQALSKAFLNLPVGEIAAATEGRAPTAAEKRMTVRDAGRRDDPDFDRKFAAQMARTRPLVEQSLKAVGSALPTIMQSFKQAGEAIERAAANMPDPTYPRR